MADASKSFVVGWEEWVALPDLGLPAIKAKVDTGARTSALHAYLVEPFGPAAAPIVRFAIHPVPGRSDISITCTAPVIDRREVTSSNGDREQRYVIQTRVVMGARAWPIEITLANREGMSYRMLLGRQAIRDDMVVDPTASFRQPRLSFKLYRGMASGGEVRRSLTIALLTRRQLSPSNRRIVAEAERHGHQVALLDPGALAIPFADHGRLADERGAQIGPFDAVVPRLGPGPFAAALVRQLEAAGCFAMNSGDAIDRLRSPLAALQALSAHGVPVLPASADAGDWSDAWRATGERRPRRRMCVIGRHAEVALEQAGEQVRVLDIAAAAREQAIAERAAEVLGLRLASIDLVETGAGPCVAGFSPSPDIGWFEKHSGRRLARAIIADVVANARGLAAADGDGADQA